MVEPLAWLDVLFFEIDRKVPVDVGLRWSPKVAPFGEVNEDDEVASEMLQWPLLVALGVRCGCLSLSLALDCGFFVPGFRLEELNLLEGGPDNGMALRMRELGALLEMSLTAAGHLLDG